MLKYAFSFENMAGSVSINVWVSLHLEGVRACSDGGHWALLS